MLVKRVGKYFIGLLLSFLLLLFLLLLIFIYRGEQLDDFLELLPTILKSAIGNPIFWSLLHIPLLVVLLVRYWIKGYKKGKGKLVLKRFLYSALIPSLFFFALMKAFGWYQKSEDFHYIENQKAYNLTGRSIRSHLKDGKIRGMHVFGLRGLDSTEIARLTSGNIEHVVLVPYADQEDIDSPTLGGSWGEKGQKRDSIYGQIISRCQALGVEVILKPHVWIFNPSDGKWRADLWMNSEKDWQKWESSYRDFVLEYASISQKYDLPLFCIGNEFYLSTTKRPHFWISLIEEVRNVYNGKLTYGANWDREFREITFWDKLDYIGIQSYFPLVDHDYPDLDSIEKGWEQHLSQIASVSSAFDKKVIFTELGYKSTPDAATTPWEWDRISNTGLQKISNQTQVRCYEAFFKKVWSQEWFAGAMIWQWQTQETGEEPNLRFSPKGKPAFNEIAKGYQLSDPAFR